MIASVPAGIALTCFDGRFWQPVKCPERLVSLGVLYYHVACPMQAGHSAIHAPEGLLLENDIMHGSIRSILHADRNVSMVSNPALEFR